MNKLFIFILPILILGACNNKKSTLLTGNYPGEGHEYLYINRIDIDIPVPIDSVKIKKTGDFKIKLESDQVEFYTIGFSNSEFITILSHPGDKIEVNFTKERLQNEYSVSGSTESEKIRLLDKKLGKTLIRLDSLRNEYDNAINSEALNDKTTAIEQVYNETIKQQRKNNIKFILDNLHNFSAIKALYQSFNENTYVLYETRDLQYLKLVSDTLNKHYPNSRLSKSLEKNLKTGLNQMYLDKFNTTIDQASSTKLDANLLNTEDKRISLSSVTKNNYVLLSFWVTGSQDCITNNLQMKQIYSKYHRKGFEIYQVNLDTDEEKWKNFVRYDEIPWISVKEDDPSKPLTANLFNIKEVPANYLFDKQGEIIAKNLFGKALQIKLTQLFD